MSTSISCLGMRSQGTLYAIGAYIIWGLFPLYWKQLEALPALQLVAHRITWSFVLLFLFVLVTGQSGSLASRLNPPTLRTYSLAAVLIGANWYVYVWAVTHGLVVEASLGYYINPLFSVLLGILVFQERLRGIQWLPIALAALGVLYLSVSYGSFPWIALILAVTFGLYGVLKKTAGLGSLFGLLLETGILFGPAIAYLGFCEWSGQGAFLHTTAKASWMMVGGGIVTGIPLLLFAAAVTRVPLATVGILQYVNPTMQFLLGTLVYHEPFTQARLIGFAIVWAALMLFWVEGLYARRSAGGTVLPELGEG